MALGSVSATNRLRDLTDFCDYAAEALQGSRPRILSAFCEKRPVLVFTDGAWENQAAGIGAVLIDTATNMRWVLAGEVPSAAARQMAATGAGPTNLPSGTLYYGGH